MASRSRYDAEQLCHGAAYEEVSEEAELHDGAPLSSARDIGRRPESSSSSGGGRLGRAAAVGALAAVTVMCLLGARAGPARIATAAVTGLLGRSDQGEHSVLAALQAAERVKHLGNLSVVPQENRHDGNPCNDDEEPYGGLCYERCALMTGGEYVHRQSPWTCCNRKVCGSLFTLAKCCKHNAGFCSGFDIAGMAEGNKICPHKPGACLADEELFLNICYMKCSLLTGGMYPYRTAAATCCKSRDARCFAEDGAEDGVDGTAITNASLACGGGCGDHSNRTHCQPHLPQLMVTEQAQ